MFEVNPEAQVRIYTKPMDLRKGARGLLVIIQTQIKANLWNGELFVFFNRQCSLVKIIFWDGTGFMVCTKRLLRGRFANLFQDIEGNTIHLTPEQMRILLSGARPKKILSAQK